MLQYGSYPIYVVYSRHTQEALYNVAIDYLNEGNKETYMHMTDTGISRMEILEDTDPAYKDEVIDFETTIKRQLDKIAGSVVGKAVLNSLYPAARLFIIPFAYNKDVAQTGWSRTVGEGNGMHIRINPDDWTTADNLDDALLHELTHAVRFGWSRFSPKMLMNAGRFGRIPVEEFLGMQMANVYRASRGKTQYYADYNYEWDANNKLVPVWGNKKSIYDDFVESAEVIMALKFCLQREPLAAQAANIAGTEFNPFRDYPHLEKEAKKRMGWKDTDQFMPL